MLGINFPLTMKKFMLSNPQKVFLVKVMSVENAIINEKIFFVLSLVKYLLEKETE